MCGIAGVWPVRQDDASARRFIAVALEKMKSRGPDGSSQIYHSGAWLAHRRLAIQDLSNAAAQPMSDSAKRYWIVFNGEIYNHRKLRQQFLSHVDFATTSDTETLLHLLIEKGVDGALPLLRGMFAFGFYDNASESFVLARDAFGEKPLSYYFDGEQLRFSSTLQPLRDYIGDSVDISSLVSFLQFGYVSGRSSIIENVKKVQPGSVVRFTVDYRKQKLIQSESRFFSISQTNHSPGVKGYQRHELADAIESSVREQLISDVPIGCFLSGGVDSSLIAALMQRANSSPINTFTISFDDPEFDESRHAEEVARHIGSRHHTQVVSESELLACLSDLTRAYDEPFSDPSMLPTMQLCRFAREHVTVCLSGDGADELFGGYMKYQRAYALPYLRRVGFLQKAFGYIRQSDWPSGHRARKAIAVLLSENGQELNTALMMLNATPKDFVEETLARRVELTFPSYPAMSDARYLRQMMQNDQQNYLPDDILFKVDRAAMAYSLEVRAPFLSTSVFDASLALSDRELISGGANKKEIREILYGLVPKRLVDRPKKGFSVPIGKWMRGPLKDWGSTIVHSHTPYLSRYRMRRDWERLQRGDLSSAGRMWSLLMFAAWYHGISV